LSSLAAVGIFGIGYRFTLPVIFLVSAFGQAWTPIYFSLRKEFGNRVKLILPSITTYVVTVFFFITLAVAMLGYEACIILTPPEYHPAYKVIPFLGLTYFFQGLYFLAVNEIFYEKRTWLIPLVTSSSALTNVILNMILIPQYGALGAAVAACAGGLVSFFIVFVISNRLYPIPYQYGRLGKLFLVGFLVLFASWYVNTFEFTIWATLGIKLLMLGLFPIFLLVMKVFSVKGLLGKHVSLFGLSSRFPNLYRLGTR